MSIAIRIDDAIHSRRIELDDGRHVIGRAAECAIRLDHGRISRQHAALRIEPDGVWVEDLGSRNGTYLDGQPVTTARRWQPGETLTVADVALRIDDGRPMVPRTGHSARVRLDENPSASPLAELSMWNEPGKPVDDRDRIHLVVATVGELLARPFDPEEITEPLLDLVEKALKPERVLLMLRGEDDALALQASRVPPSQADVEVALSSALVSRVLSDRTSFLVSDALADPELMARESIIRTRMRTALVVPLFDNHEVLGILYADRGDVMHPFTADDLRILTVLGNLIAMAINQARLREVEGERERLSQELVAAHGVIAGILGDALPEIEGWRTCHHLDPCTEVGGDFYDIYHCGDGRWGVLLGDVSGHGLGAALLVAQIVPVVRLLLAEHRDPLAILQRLNNHLCETTAAHAFATVFLGLLDAETGVFTYANAGHVPPLHRVAASGEIQRLASCGLPVGMLTDAPLRQESCQLAHDDLLLICSDGVTECCDAEEDMYGEERLHDLVAGIVPCSPAVLRDRLLAALASHRGEVTADDDITLLALQRTPAARDQTAPSRPA